MGNTHLSVTPVRTELVDRLSEVLQQFGEGARRSNRYVDFSRVNNSESLKGGRSEQRLLMSIDLAESDSY